MQADQPGRAESGLPPASRIRAWAITARCGHQDGEFVDRPPRADPWPGRSCGAGRGGRCAAPPAASVAVCRARLASSPVMRATVACASSRAWALRSRRCAAIERTRRPAARLRSRNGVRVAPPAALIRLTRRDIRGHCPGEQPGVGGVVNVRRHHGGVGADFSRLHHPGFDRLGQQFLVERSDRLLAAPGGDLHQRGRVREPARRCRCGRTAATRSSRTPPYTASRSRAGSGA